MDFSNACIDEVALEGLEGITLPLFFVRLRRRIPAITIELNDDAKDFAWRVLVSSADMRFYELPEPRSEQVSCYTTACQNALNTYTVYSQVPREDYTTMNLYEFAPLRDTPVRGSCSTYQSRSDVTDMVHQMSRQDVENRFGEALCIVASQTRRERALFGGITQEQFEKLGYTISDEHYCVLEAIARTRYDGWLPISSNELSIQTVLRSRLGHLINVLIRFGLIYKQPVEVSANGNTSVTFMMHLSRFRVVLMPSGANRLETICSYIHEHAQSNVAQPARQNTTKGASASASATSKPKRCKLEPAARLPQPLNGPLRLSWTIIRQDLKSMLRHSSGKSDKILTLKRLRESFRKFNADDAGKSVYLRVTMAERKNKMELQAALEETASEPGSEAGDADKETEVREDFDEEVEKLIGPVHVNFTMLRRFRYFEWLLNNRRLEKIATYTDNPPATASATATNTADLCDADSDDSNFDSDAEVSGEITQRVADPLSASDNWMNPSVRIPIINRILLIICQYFQRNPDTNGVDRSRIRRILHLTVRDCESLMNRLVKQNAVRVGLIDRGRQKLFSYTPNYGELPYSDTRRLVSLSATNHPQFFIDQKCLGREFFRRKLGEVVVDSNSSLQAMEETFVADSILVEDIELPAETELDAANVDADCSLVDLKQDSNSNVPSTKRLSEEKVKANNAQIITLSERFQKRAAWIEQIVNDTHIIANHYQLRNLVRKRDELDGYNSKLDRRSLTRLLYYLASQDRIRLVDFVLPVAKASTIQLVVSPKVDTQSEDFTNTVLHLPYVLEQINSHHRAMNMKRVRLAEVKKPDPFPKDKPTSRLVRWMYGFRPRMRRIQILHEFLYYLVYAYEGRPQPPVDNSPIVYVDRADCWKRYVAPMVRETKDGVFYTSDVLRLLPLSVFCAILPLSTPSDELLAWLLDPDMRHYPISDLPSHFASIVHRKSDGHQRRFVDLLKHMSLLGLITFVTRSDDQQHVNSMKLNASISGRRGRSRRVAMHSCNTPHIDLFPLAYLNRKAALLNTFSVTLRTGNSTELFGQAPEREFRTIEFEFNHPTDLIRYWNTLIRLSFRSGVGVQVQRTTSSSASHPPLSNAMNRRQHRRTHDSLEKQLIKYLTVQSLTNLVDGRLPAGDHQGCAGLDSRFYVHNLRAWYAPRVLRRDRLLIAGFQLDAFPGQRVIKPIRIVSLIDEALVSNDEHTFALSRFYQQFRSHRSFKTRTQQSNGAADLSKVGELPDEVADQADVLLGPHDEELAMDLLPADGNDESGTGVRARRTNAHQFTAQDQSRDVTSKAFRTGRIGVGARRLPGKPTKGRHNLDRIDREIVKRIGSGRSRWTFEQRKSCLIFRAASMILFGVCNPRMRIGVSARVLRDLMHSWHPEAVRDKTSDSIRKACMWNLISKTMKHNLRRLLSAMYSEAISDKSVKEKFFGKFPNCNAPPSMDRNFAFIELCEYLRNGLTSVQTCDKRISGELDEDEDGPLEVFPRSLSELRRRFDVTYTTMTASRNRDTIDTRSLARIVSQVSTSEDGWFNGTPTETDAQVLTHSNLMLAIAIVDLLLLERLNNSVQMDFLDSEKSPVTCAIPSERNDRLSTQTSSEECYWLNTVQQHSALFEMVRERLVTRLAMRRPRYNDTCVAQYTTVQRAAANGTIDAHSNSFRKLLRNRIILRGWLLTQPFRRWFLNEWASCPNALFDEMATLMNSVRLRDDSQRANTSVPFTTRSILELDAPRFVTQFVHCAFVLANQVLQGSLRHVAQTNCLFQPIRVPRIVLQLDEMGKVQRVDDDAEVDGDVDQSELEEDDPVQESAAPKRHRSYPYLGSLYKCHIHRCECIQFPRDSQPLSDAVATLPDTDTDIKLEISNQPVVQPQPVEVPVPAPTPVPVPTSYQTALNSTCARNMISLRSLTDSDVYVEPKPCFVTAHIPASSFEPPRCDHALYERAANCLWTYYSDLEVNEAELSRTHVDLAVPLANSRIPIDLTSINRCLLHEAYIVVRRCAAAGITFECLLDEVRLTCRETFDVHQLELVVHYLVKAHYVLVVGGFNQRFVALAHARNWLIERYSVDSAPENNEYFVPKPFLDADGTIQSDALSELLKTLLWHIMNAPGIALKILVARYEPLFSRVVLIELLCLLVKINCLTVTTFRSITPHAHTHTHAYAEPLFAPRRSFIAEVYDPAVLDCAYYVFRAENPENVVFEANADCVVRMAFFVRYLIDQFG